MTVAKEARKLSSSLAALSILFVLLLTVYSCPSPASALNTITHLPGFHGTLPFYLETGYVKVDEVNDAQLFYYFIKSERKPEEDPLMVWLTGGPGCSAFSGLVFEIGPLKFDVAGYTEGLPTLVYNPYSWTKVCNIIFLDSPVGTGFSYSSVEKSYETGDTKAAQQVHTFLRKWLIDHPEFLSNPLYIGGDSYSGIVVPVVAQEIAKGDRDGDELLYNLKGYIVGNPGTDAKFDNGAFVPYAHGMGLISDELYESTKKSCGGEYASPRNEQCANHLQSINECIEGINTGQILEPLCFFASPKPSIVAAYSRRLLKEDIKEFPLLKADLPLECRTYGYLLSYIWADNDTVREALNIHKRRLRLLRTPPPGPLLHLPLQTPFRPPAAPLHRPSPTSRGSCSPTPGVAAPLRASIPLHAASPPGRRDSSMPSSGVMAPLCPTPVRPPTPPLEAHGFSTVTWRMETLLPSLLEPEEVDNAVGLDDRRRSR